MATLRELLGEAYREGMSFEDVENALKGKKLFDLSTGEYVSKAKYEDDTRLLAELQAQAEGKQAEIDAAVRKAVEEAQARAKAEYEAQLEEERTAQRRKRARERAYEGLTEEQKGLYEAFVKDEELKLSEDGESFVNFDELAKPVREKYKTVFPVDDGSHGKGGVTPAKAPAPLDEFAGFEKLR